MSCACSEDVTIRGDEQERGWPEPGWAKETVLPLGKANAALKETRKKKQPKNQTTTHLPPCAWCYPKEPLAEVEAWPEFPGSKVQARELRTGHTETPSVSLLFCKEGREWRGESAFLI